MFSFCICYLSTVELLLTLWGSIFFHKRRFRFRNIHLRCTNQTVAVTPPKTWQSECRSRDVKCWSIWEMFTSHGRNHSTTLAQPASAVGSLNPERFSVASAWCHWHDSSHIDHSVLIFYSLACCFLTQNVLVRLVPNIPLITSHTCFFSWSARLHVFSVCVRMNHFHPTSYSPEDDPFLKLFATIPESTGGGGREKRVESLSSV